MYICVYSSVVCIHVWYVHMHVCRSVHMCVVCIHGCDMYICMYTFGCPYVRIHKYICVQRCMVCTYVCGVCTYVCMCLHMPAYIHAGVHACACPCALRYMHGGGYGMHTGRSDQFLLKPDRANGRTIASVLTLWEL